MVDKDKFWEEKLREYACIGDLIGVQELIAKGVDINSKNIVNGWTPLHWAAHRNHPPIIKLLLSQGADVTLLNHRGDSAADVCESQDCAVLFDREVKPKPELPIILSYIKHPALPEQTESRTLAMNNSTPNVNHSNCNSEEVVLKVRIANCGDPDFIEIELPRHELTFSKLVKTCCEELNTSPGQVTRIRKLPNTLLRKDKDIQRLVDYQEIELVLSSPCTAPSNNGLLSLPVTPSSTGNNYESIYLRKNQTILY